MQKALSIMGRIGVAAACLVVPAIGCAASEPTARHESESSAELPIFWHKSGTHSRLARPVRLVVRDAATMARLPLAEVPVDFDTQMVLVVGLGPTPTSDIGVHIVRVWREGSRICVQVQQVHPGADRPTGFEPASPWAVAVVPRSDLNVERFETRVPAGLLADHPGSR